MKKERRLFFVLAMLLFLPIFNFGQSHEMVVPDFYSNSTFLNDIIWGDTLAGGVRADLERVYVLKRGGSYYVNTSLANQTTKSGNWPLRIKAEAGSGPRPVVYAYRRADNTYAAEIFNNYNTLELTSIAMVGWAEGIEEFDRNTTRLINGAGVGHTLILDDCILKDGSATLVQTSVAANYIRATNSIFANSANLKQTNLGNGRAFDFRDVSVDSVHLENCSFMNFTDRVLRHYNAKAPINKFTVIHNTFLNILAEHGCISLGRIQGDIKINDNLFVDHFIFGNDSTTYKEANNGRAVEFAYTEETLPNGQPTMTFIGSVPNDTSYISWEIKNNYYSVSPALQAFWDGKQPAGLGDLVPLTAHITGKLGSAAANAFHKLTTPIVFGSAPATPLNFAEWFFTPIEQGGSGKTKSQANFNAALHDFDRKTIEYYNNATGGIDLKYSQTSPAFTGATDGKPVGSLVYWAGIVSVEKTDLVPTAFALEQNYPNPFNPATIITYNVPMAGKVKLEVFDILGRNVATLIDQEQEVGQYKVDFDGSKLSSGVYVYRLSSQGVQLTKKMMLMK